MGRNGYGPKWSWAETVMGRNDPESKLEMVQHRAARYVLHRHRNTSSVTDMLQTLNWRSLESRRKDMRLCMMFKIDRGLVAVSKDSRLIQQKRLTRHSHSRAFQTITCGTGQRRERESIIGVQWGQGNPNLRVHRSSGKRGFPTGTVDPRVGISRFHCTPMIHSISHISNKE